MDSIERMKMIKEIGHIMEYIATVIKENNISFEEVLQYNMTKECRLRIEKYLDNKLKSI